MDVVRASASVDELIERRAQERSNANEIAQMWAESVVRDREKRRRENRAAWYSYHLMLAENHRLLFEEHEAKALALLEDPLAEPTELSQSVRSGDV